MSGRDDDGHDWTPDEALALEAVGHAAAMARNDPNYMSDLEEMKRDVDQMTREVARVTLVDRPGGQHIEVDLARPRHRPAAMQTASTLARLAEAELHVDRRQAGRQAGDTPAETRFAQPPRHTHYKDDRPEPPPRSGPAPAARKI